MRFASALTLTLLLTATLTGCAGIGKQDFACPGQPSKPLCLSTSEVYRLTDDARLPRSDHPGESTLQRQPPPPLRPGSPPRRRRGGVGLRGRGPGGGGR